MKSWKQNPSEKKTQNQLENRVEKETKENQFNRAETIFLNSISHDIRTPLNVIIGYTALASAHVNEAQEVKKYLSKIEAASNHLLLLINDVLDMSHIESGTLKLEHAPVYLPDVLENLKAIICISKACYNTFQEVLGIQTNKLVQIYPLIKDQRLTLKKSSEDKQLTCLYISSNFELKSGLELLEVSEKIQNVNFIFVTREKTISKEILNRIKKASNIQLIEFNLNKKELNSLYLMSDILIHATRQDSFGLVVLEAVKMGLPVLATNMYAIKEMVIDNYNGFLVTPKYQFFDDNDIPNASVWNHRKSTINKTFVDNNIVNFLETKINFYDKNRDKLEEMSKNSFELSQKEFSENSIKGKWDDLFHRTLR